MAREPTPPPNDKQTGDAGTGANTARRKTTPGRPKGRVLTLTLAIIFMIGVGAWLFRTDIATAAANAGLRAYGLDGSLSVEALSFRHATFTQISLPPHLTAARIDLRYSLQQLLSGRLESISLSDLHLTDVVTAPNANDSPTLTIQTIPVNHIEVKSGAAMFNTSQGIAKAQFSLTLGPARKGRRSLKATITTRLNSDSATGTIGGTIDGTVAVLPGQAIELTGQIKGAANALSAATSFSGAVDAFFSQSGHHWARLELSKVSIDAPSIKADVSEIVLHLNYSHGTSVEIDLTGITQLQPAEKTAWPRLRFALGGNFPMGENKNPVGFHLRLDSSKIWGRLEGRVLAGQKLSGAFNFNGVEEIFTAHTHGTFQASFADNQSITSGVTVSEAGLWRHDENIAALSGTLSGALSAAAQTSPDPARFSLVGTIHPDWIASLTAPSAHAKGAIGFDVNGDFRIESLANFDVETFLRALTAEGHITLAVNDLDAPGIFQAQDITGQVGFVLKDTSLDLTTTDELRLSGATITHVSTPPFIRRLLTGNVRLSAAPDALRLLNLLEDPVAILPQSLFVATPRASVRLLAPARVQLDQSLGLVDAQAPEIAIQLNGAFPPAANVSIKGVLRDIRITPQKVLGKIQISGKGDVEQAPSRTSVKAAIGGAFSRIGDRATFTLSPDSTLELSETSIAGALTLHQPLILSPVRAATFALDMSTRKPHLTYGLRLKPIKTILNARLGDETIPIAISLPTVSLSGSSGGHKFIVEHGGAALPAHNLGFRDISLTVSAHQGSGTEGSESATATFAINTIEHRGDSPWITPLTLHATATLRDKQVRLKARLGDKSGNVQISANAAHNLAENSGSLSLKTGRITFLPTVLQPDAISPMLRHKFREVDGDIDINANIEWRDNVLKSSGEVLIEARKFVTDEYSIANAVTLIAFDNLFPPSTPPEQIIEIGIVDIGVPITDGRVVFQVRPDGAIRAGLEKFNLFGGRIETRPITLPRDFDNFTIPLAVTGVQLNELLTIAKFGELSATGALDGLLPLTITHGEVAVRGGVLETTGAGAIKYQPKAVGDVLSDVNAGAALFLDLIKNFEYDKIRVTLDEGEFEEIVFGFKIDGRNRAVYNGIPVNLNITLSGPLRKILLRGYETFTTPAWLQDKIQQFRQKQTDG